MSKGKLIVIEGACDGIGKTTQYQMLIERLKNDNINVINHHFPTYNTYQGKPVEMYLSGEFGSMYELSPYFINMLYANDRVITWNTKLKNEYEKGNIILLDRYTTSSLIYQSALIDDIDKKKEFIDYVCDFEYNKLGIPKPDNVIFLVAPFDLVTKIRTIRNQNNGTTSDIHEKNMEYMKKVYENAIFVCEYLGWNKIECSDNNQMKNIEDIHNNIYTLIKKR